VGGVDGDDLVSGYSNPTPSLMMDILSITLRAARQKRNLMPNWPG
jgi:hypothetical protein